MLFRTAQSVESPSHKIRSELDGSRVCVSLAGDEGRMDRDFVLLLTAVEPASAISCQVRDRDRQDERFVIASFRPEISVERKPVEVLILVDCSGSMGGPSIEEARRTLRLCLRSLEPGDRFNITRFGSSHESLFSESLVYNDQTLREADRYVAQMRPDLGGTEILAPLLALLTQTRATASRSIMLLTDGQVSNENEVIALAREHRHDTRIFAFGIGHGASEFLVRGVARASRGAAEFVYPGERIEDKVMRHFSRIVLPISSHTYKCVWPWSARS